MPWPFIWFNYKGPHSKEVDKALSQIVKNEDPKPDTFNVKFLKVQDKVKNTPKQENTEELNMYFVLVNILGSMFTIAIYMLGFLLTIKYMFVIFGEENQHASVNDVYIGIGVIVGMLIADCIFTHPNKEKPNVKN